ncbi:MAG TPA: hypothetical protein PLG90_13345 [Ignavibacteria bacterium]|nr:hypothetical protein [Ignavibacteria bacterium]
MNKLLFLNFRYFLLIITPFILCNDILCKEFPDSLLIHNNFFYKGIESIDYENYKFEGYYLVEVNDTVFYNNSDLFLNSFFINNLNEIDIDSSKLFYIYSIQLYISFLNHFSEKNSNEKIFSDMYLNINKNFNQKCNSFLYNFGDSFLSGLLNNKDLYIYKNKKYYLFKVCFFGYKIKFLTKEFDNEKFQTVNSIIPVSSINCFFDVDAILLEEFGFIKSDDKISFIKIKNSFPTIDN